MATKKVPAKVREIRDFKVKQVAGAKSISFSQLSVYLNCPRCWERMYLRKEAPFEPSIHLIFGTAMHETLQLWLDTLYNNSVKAAGEMNLPNIFEEKFKNLYLSTRKTTGKDFSTSAQLQEFYEDAVAILDYIVKHRLGIFSTKKTYLVGCEIPIYTQLQKNFYFKGYVDILTYEEGRDVWKIWDIKTSTRGWSEEKKDFIKCSQVSLYREFLHRQFDIPLEKIETEYLIVKRKLPQDPIYPAQSKRIQEFSPGDGPKIHNKVVNQINTFLTEAISSEGEYFDKTYSRNPSDKNCKWCVFKDTCTS